ncbi:NAD-dependent epimerase/dehydratase family protein [Cupriavidus sp. YAF13]|uniref:NAD-dependent epimerase/dehydratase family protein n=1 Tax=Cupriavidus sp. YAF13 TaxID=3233075 RepID=UPI003F9014B3
MKVALSGASGNVGRILRVELQRRGIDLRSAGGMEPLTPLHDGEEVMHGDLRDPAVVDRMLAGVDVLVHMAGTSLERSLQEIIENNLVALHQVYEGARRHKVRRIVFASSNHAFGMHAIDARLGLNAEVRPDGLYGLSKVWGEAMARMYWDKHGIEGISLRIGTTMGRPPENFRQLSTWMGTEDLVQLVMRSIQANDVGYAAVWGISANTRAYYDLKEGNAIGYAPTQNAEDWASEILAQPTPLDPIAQHFQGGPFVTIDYTQEQQRPSKAQGLHR